MRLLHTIIMSGAVLLAVEAQPATALTDVYGSVGLSGVYSESNSDFDDEETQGSAIVPRASVGARWGEAANQTRVQASSTYYGYFDRQDRWYNAVEAEHIFTVSKDVRFGLEAFGALNTSTVEARSADQLGVAGHLIFEPNEANRFTLTGGMRRRFYDDTSAKSWAPLADIDYHHRFGRHQYLDLSARQEWVNSNDQFYEYRRTSVEAFYTHPLGKKTRVRGGIAARWWHWDSRLTPDLNRRDDRLYMPQVRLTHDLTKHVDVELDYRRLIRRSNDNAFDRNGNRLAATVRYQF